MKCVGVNPQLRRMAVYNYSIPMQEYYVTQLAFISGAELNDNCMLQYMFGAGTASWFCLHQNLCVLLSARSSQMLLAAKICSPSLFWTDARCDVHWDVFKPCSGQWHDGVPCNILRLLRDSPRFCFEKLCSALVPPTCFSIQVGVVCSYWTNSIFSSVCSWGSSKQWGLFWSVSSLPGCSHCVFCLIICIMSFNEPLKHPLSAILEGYEYDLTVTLYTTEPFKICKWSCNISWIRAVLGVISTCHWTRVQWSRSFMWRTTCTLNLRLFNNGRMQARHNRTGN